ncbi:MAG TPA: hypothetical protein VF921_03650, partial [Vicinamibacterales bacterium]
MRHRARPSAIQVHLNEAESLLATGLLDAAGRGRIQLGGLALLAGAGRHLPVLDVDRFPALLDLRNGAREPRGLDPAPDQIGGREEKKRPEGDAADAESAGRH